MMKKKQKEDVAEMTNLYDLISQLQNDVQELQDQHIILLRELLEIKNRLD
jgi:hypothetical protein